MLPEISEKLRDPFPPEAIRQRAVFDCPECKRIGRDCPAHAWSVCTDCGEFAPDPHQHVDYVGHAWVRERLDDVDPGWTWEPMGQDERGLPAFDHLGGLWITLIVGGHGIPGYGSAGPLRNSDSVKSAIGDALRNAAMSRGVARDMWKQRTAAEEPTATYRTPEGIKQTDEDRCNELRGQIRAITRRMGWSAIDLANRYAERHQGKDFLKETFVSELAEFKDHVQQLRWPRQQAKTLSKDGAP